MTATNQTKSAAPAKNTGAFITQNGTRLFTVNEVMDELHLKYRDNVDKYVHQGLLKVHHLQGEAAKLQGRRFLFTKAAITQLKAHLAKQTKAPTPPVPQAEPSTKNAAVMTRLNAAIKKLENLEKAVGDLQAKIDQPGTPTAG